MVKHPRFSVIFDLFIEVVYGQQLFMVMIDRRFNDKKFRELMGVFSSSFFFISGTSIDQGIAYVLMLVALVLTYLIHAADLSHIF